MLSGFRKRGFTIQRVLASALQWLLQPRFLVNGDTTFMLLTPPGLKRQLVWDFSEHRGLRFRADSYYDWGTLFEVFVRNEYLPRSVPFEKRALDLYQELVNSGRTPLILDLGANLGSSTVLFALKFPQARIIALEPHGGNFSKLVENCRPYQNIDCRNAGIAAQDGLLNLFEGSSSGNNAFRTFGDESALAVGRVDGVSPQTLIAGCSRETPFLVKIDIEGYEENLFSRHSEWLDSFPIVMAEPHDWMIPGRGSSNAMVSSILRRQSDVYLSGQNLLAIRLQ